MKALVGPFNKEKGLSGHFETWRRFVDIVDKAGSSPVGRTVCGNRAMFLSNHRLSDLDLFSAGTRPHGHMFSNANDRYLPKQFLARVYGRVAGSRTRVTPGTWISTLQKVNYFWADCVGVTGKSVTNTVSVSLCPAAGSTSLPTLACLRHFCNRHRNILVFSIFDIFNLQSNMYVKTTTSIC